MIRRTLRYHSELLHPVLFGQIQLSDTPHVLTRLYVCSRAYRATGKQKFGGVVQSGNTIHELHLSFSGLGNCEMGALTTPAVTAGFMSILIVEPKLFTWSVGKHLTTEMEVSSFADASLMLSLSQGVRGDHRCSPENPGRQKDQREKQRLARATSAGSIGSGVVIRLP